MTNKKST